MKLGFRKSFDKDLTKRSEDKKLLLRVQEIIKEIEDANNILKIKNP